MDKVKRLLIQTHPPWTSPRPAAPPGILCGLAVSRRNTHPLIKITPVKPACVYCRVCYDKACVLDVRTQKHTRGHQSSRLNKQSEEECQHVQISNIHTVSCTNSKLNWAVLCCYTDKKVTAAARRKGVDERREVKNRRHFRFLAYHDQTQKQILTTDESFTFINSMVLLHFEELEYSFLFVLICFDTNTIRRLHTSFEGSF